MNDEWVETTVGELLTFEYGKPLPERAREEGSVPVFGSNGVVGHHSEALVSGPGIVVGRKGTAGSVTWSDKDFFPIDTTFWVRTKQQTSLDLDLAFVHLLLLHADLPGVCAQTGVPGLNRDRAYEVPVTIPPLSVQRRIVDLMGHLDTHLANLEAELDAATILRGKARQILGSGTGRRLIDLAARDGIQIGPFGSQLHAYEYTDQGTPVVMPQDLVDGEIRLEKIKRVPESVAERLSKHRLAAGDIVFPRRGDLSKRAVVVGEQAGWLCGTGCLRFRAADADVSTALFEAIANDSATEWLVEHAVGTTMLNLNTTILSGLPVPDWNESTRTLADAASALGTHIRSLRVEVDAAQETRRQILTSLLSGTVEIPESDDELLGVV